ncbi:MAG: SRPBCC domain-containing protein [Candidatus Cloacimonetes bacterium]|nr:SRPBCC domain-containing protein [Candidatus Cloacimonadota bacterium]
MKDKVINKSILVSSPISKVFSALTDSSKIIKYFPLKEVISKWIVGSEVLYKGSVDGVSFTDYGTILTLDEPTEYTYAYWSDNHGTERADENQVKISYRLSEENGQTMISVSQSNLPNQELYTAMDTAVWDFLLGSLKNYLEKK